jgi:hypothetical protein
LSIFFEGTPVPAKDSVGRLRGKPAVIVGQVKTQIKRYEIGKDDRILCKKAQMNARFSMLYRGVVSDDFNWNLIKKMKVEVVFNFFA